jgi:hypothetical protein
MLRAKRRRRVKNAAHVAVVAVAVVVDAIVIAKSVRRASRAKRHQRVLQRTSARLSRSLNARRSSISHRSHALNPVLSLVGRRALNRVSSFRLQATALGQVVNASRVPKHSIS